MHRHPEHKSVGYDPASRTWTYEVVALSVPIVFNKHRDHDRNGMMYALAENAEYLEGLANQWRGLLHGHGHGHDPADMTPDEKCGCVSHSGEHAAFEEFKPEPLVRPLVLRARKGDAVRVELINRIRCRRVGMHLIGPGYGVSDDGSEVGGNPSSLLGYGEKRTYNWECEDEGVFLFHDIGDPDGDEDGTNTHGLFGALIVEPEGAWWTDPTRDYNDPAALLSDGLYADVHQRPPEELEGLTDKPAFAGQPNSMRPPKYAPERASFREYVLFIHDEPEVRELNEHEDAHAGGEHRPPTAEHAKGPCFEALPDRCEPDPHGGEHQSAETPGGSHGATHEKFPHGSLMLFNYRSEPMKNRERLIWKWLKEKKLKKTVINEEQHHSSWMFGDPDTPVLKAYLGDPVRIRLIHAGVKETHVFHLHLYEWHADPENRRSPLIDAITITPGTGHTIEPLFGAGNVHAVPGDVIWHCHLYPHFHMGMWGMFRTFDTLHEGQDGAPLPNNGAYTGRRIGRYPDGTRIEKLAVLPDRQPPPKPTPEKPGFPLFIAGEMEQKSPVPPWPENTEAGPLLPDYDYRPATPLEAAAMNSDPKPGELFTYFPHPDKRSLFADLDGDGVSETLVERPQQSQVDHKVVAAHGCIDYNEDGWHDPDGHFYYLAGIRDNGGHPKPEEPLFFRARHGDVLNLEFKNAIGFREPEGPDCARDGTPIPKPSEGQLERMDFDYNIPPCDEIIVENSVPPVPAECGLHVHMVKFDPICADGASTGWNYMSAPSDGKKMFYRWWCDEEFGVIFCHDHLFANTRQRHGLFGALLVEPEGSEFYDPFDRSKEALTGLQAVIERPDGSRFREFCLGLGDWVAMYDHCNHDRPLEGPEDHPSSHDDNGTMAVNYRCAPLRERGDSPELWFSSDKARGGKGDPEGDPDTTVFETFPNEKIYLRLVQGSHEEQHSFQVHGMRWRRFPKDPSSPVRNQQTLGISEAFTFVVDEPYGAGDYLWRFSGAEDTWLGCWGLIRAHDRDAPGDEKPWPIEEAPRLDKPDGPDRATPRRFRVKAVRREIVYREGGGARTRLVDPKGLAFIATHMARPGSEDYRDIPEPAPLEPLILRCRQGEWVEIELKNELHQTLEAEAHPPELPVEGDRNDPSISTHVSLHADLLSYDVKSSDGVTAGRNPIQTVPSGGHRTCLFHADVEPGPVLLQDLADVRNHRHHGLFGTLIVEPRGTVPLAVPENEPTAPERIDGTTKRAWSGSRATLWNKDDDSRVEEIVLLLHDGIRYYKDGEENDEEEPPDPADIPGDMGEEPDTEDQGQKAFNYRSERLDLAFEDMKACKDEHGHDQHPNVHDRKGWFKGFTPATPTFLVPTESDVAVRFVCAADKPRNHGFTLHGHGWKEWPHTNGMSPVVSSEGGISVGTARTYAFKANSQPGDYLYRSGVLKWAVAQGLWGTLRLRRRGRGNRNKIVKIAIAIAGLAIVAIVVIGRMRKAT